MVVDAYLTDFEKMVLVVESLKEYKRTVVEEFGIGEDLTFNLFGWRGDGMAIVGQLSPSHMADKVGRLRRLISAAIIFRTGFACDALTFGAEGFCVVGDGEAVDGIPLNEQYPTNPDVMECITVLQVGSEVDMAAVPYRYELGRKVVFGNVARNPDPDKFGIVTTSLRDIIQLPIETTMIGKKYFVQRLVDGLESDGFEVTRLGE